jgi:Zn-dependent protease
MTGHLCPTPLQYRPMGFGLLQILRDDPLVFFLLAVALIEAIAMHEYAHALAADLQGDRMPRAFGRLTLNPAKHLDPLGTLMLLLVGFGWGKPVEFRPQALSSRRFGGAIVALAGPMMNLVLALAAALVGRIMGLNFRFPLFLVTGDRDPIALFLLLFFSINVLLAVFNLIPLPPLDGSRLLTIFLPPDKQRIIYFLDQYGFLILLALLFFGGFRIIEPLLAGVQDVLLTIVGS